MIPEVAAASFAVVPWEDLKQKYTTEALQRGLNQFKAELQTKYRNLIQRNAHGKQAIAKRVLTPDVIGHSNAFRVLFEEMFNDSKYEPTVLASPCTTYETYHITFP